MITISFRDRWQPVWWQRVPDEWTPLRIMTVIRSTCRRKRHLLKRKKKKKTRVLIQASCHVGEACGTQAKKMCANAPKEPSTGFLKKNNKMEKCTALQHHFTKNTLRVKHCSLKIIQKKSQNKFFSQATGSLKRCWMVYLFWCHHLWISLRTHSIKVPLSKAFPLPEDQNMDDTDLTWWTLQL